MKKRIFIFLIICLFTYSQEIETENEINIRELVQQQIDEARKRSNETTVQLSSNPITAIESKIEAKPLPLLENTMLHKLGVISIFSITVFSFVFLRRKKLSRNNSEKVFKKNIKLIREENFIKPIDPKLRKIRTRLCLTSKNLNGNETEITEIAKKYNIAKSELLLAARFNKQTARFNY